MTSQSPACGIWPQRSNRLVAVVVNESGHAALPVTVERADENYGGLLERIDSQEGLDYVLVVPDWLAKAESLAQFAHARGLVVWVAPSALVEAVRILVGSGPPRRYAAALARLPLTAFRSHLRRIEPADLRQLTLWHG
jgi:hypothetical protein